MLRRIGLIVCILGVVATLAACTGDTTKVTDLEKKVADLQTKVDASVQTETSLRTDLTAAQNQVKQLTTRVTTLETSLQNHINPPLALEVKGLTSPVLQGASATLTVKTDPGARVSVSVKVPAGQTAPSLGDKTAGRNGEITWTWKVAKTLPAGSYAVQISASHEGKTASQNTNLVVNAPAPAPAKPTK